VIRRPALLECPTPCPSAASRSIDGGTLVTSYYDWSNLHPTYEAFADTVFPVISETNLRATLGILARTAAPGAFRPGA